MVRYAVSLFQSIFKPLKAAGAPIHIQIEPIFGCNLKCLTCGGQDTTKLMSYEQYCKILDEIKPLQMTLSGAGEPFLHPSIFDMISYAKSLGTNINLTSNATVLSEEKIDRLFETGLDLISISIDAATAKTYMIMRGQDKFNRVMNNIACIVQKRKKRSSKIPKIRASFVMTKINCHEMSLFVRLANDSGIDSIYFQPLDLFYRPHMKEQLVGALTREELLQHSIDACTYAQEQKVQTNLVEILSRFDLIWKKYELQPQDTGCRRCILPWFSTYITVDGSVRPCCSIVEKGDLGNIHKHNFKEIWNSENYVHLRSNFRKGNLYFPICNNCIPVSSVFDIWQHRLRYTFGIRKLLIKQ